MNHEPLHILKSKNVDVSQWWGTHDSTYSENVTQGNDP